MTQCIHQDCNSPVYGNNKCIFHCEKDDWFIKDILGNRNWIKQTKIQAFWTAIRNDKIVKCDYDFNNYVFPDFEDFVSEDIEQTILDGNKIYKAKKVFNFWDIDKNLIFDTKATFLNATFKGNVHFECVTFRDTANFYGAIFEGNAKFNLAIVSRGIYKKATFDRETDFNSAIFQNGASFQDTIFRNRAYIENVCFENINGDTSFNGTTFQDIVSFNGSKFHNETYFSGTIFQDSALFNSLQISDNLYFNFIKLQKESLIEFGNFRLGELKLNSIQNFSSYVKLTNVKIVDKFEIKDTNLGKSELNKFDLSECNEILIQDSSFFGTIFNNVIWGKIAEERFKGSRDVFRQLKYVLEQQGNIIDANRFYSLEMKEYKKELDNKGWFSEYGQDKLVFLLHENISNYSQTWVLPLVWFFVVGISFTLLKIIHITEFEPFKRWEILLPTLLVFAYIIGRGSSERIGRFKDSKLQFYFPSIILILFFIFFVNNPLNEFANIINPFRSLTNDENYKGLEFLWFLHKSITAFIIYQFIVTLRRQTRRK